MTNDAPSRVSSSPSASVAEPQGSAGPGPASRSILAPVLKPVVSHLTSQFARPRGLLGPVAGRIMEKRGSNVDRNLWLVDLLELQADHRVLEIGPGPGVALEAAAKLATKGEFVALDHSTTMLRQTRKRNQSLVDDGRLTLVEGKAERLPVGLGGFDRIYAMNVWHFWSDQEAVIATLAELLNPGGQLFLGFQPRHRGSTERDTDAGRRCLMDQFRTAGLSDVQSHVANHEPPVAVVVGTRSS